MPLGWFLSKSRVLIGVSVLSGVMGGLGGAGLISLIHTALASQDRPVYLPWLFAGVVLLVIMARIVAALVVTHLAEHLIYELRVDLSRKILGAPLSRLQTLGAPRLLASLTEDVATVAAAMQDIPGLCISGAIVLGCLVYMGFLAWPLLFFVVTAIILGVSAFLVAKSKAIGVLQAARERQDDIFVHFRGLTEGIKELKLNRARRDAFFYDGLEPTAAAYRRYSITGQGLFILAGNIAGTLLFIVVGVILFGLPAQLSLSNSILTGFVLALLYLMAPLAELVGDLPELSRAGIALHRIKALGQKLDASSELATSGAQPRQELFPGDLELIGVTHRYRREGDDLPFVVGPIDLTIRRGQIVFLIGGNGSGKTTLALLLVGLYAPEHGEIRVGGQRINEGERERYRQQFSAVFSDFYLFDRLLGFRDHELDAEACDYLMRLQLDHKVRIEHGVFSTLDLSQGQRKRLALLVAFLEDRPFYVFDEWAADQDPVFKRIFYMEILPALKARGKTVVVITHDDGYFGVADRCLKLEDGKISEISAAEFKAGKEPRPPYPFSFAAQSDRTGLPSAQDSVRA
ncbi:MAG: cyclic peptide export ABC transporter [Gammaproteobacteria bacterium]